MWVLKKNSQTNPGKDSETPDFHLPGFVDTHDLRGGFSKAQRIYRRSLAQKISQGLSYENTIQGSSSCRGGKDTKNDSFVQA